MSLIEKITAFEIKKILPNVEIRRKYLEHLAEYRPIDVNRIRNVDLIDAIIQSWDYDLSKQILRELFRNTEKFYYARTCRDKVIELINDWNDLGFGDFDWPFQPKMFDDYVHRLNRETLSEREKDDIVAFNAIKFRRIKDINACRNDYIEYLIFENNTNVIPTFGNSRGVDFYINGEPFDQKVGRSVGRNFINTYGDDYRNIAIQRPDFVAKSLYEHQDEERFGYEPRLFVVYLDEDLTINDIETSLSQVDFNNPYEIEFEYAFSDGRQTRYVTNCYIILLHHR